MVNDFTRKTGMMVGKAWKKSVWVIVNFAELTRRKEITSRIELQLHNFNKKDNILKFPSLIENYV